MLFIAFNILPQICNDLPVMVNQKIVKLFTSLRLSEISYFVYISGVC